MAIQTRDQLKAWFTTGKKPPQGQFWDWLDSFFHKSDTIGIANVTNLQTILNSKADLASVNSLIALLFPWKVQLNGDGTYVLPAGLMMEKMIITPSADMDINVGLIPGGDEIMMIESIVANADYVVNYDLVARADRTIYFTGITAATTILIYRKTLTSQN
jgi:hypothetical protein